MPGWEGEARRRAPRWALPPEPATLLALTWPSRVCPEA